MNARPSPLTPKLSAPRWVGRPLVPWRGLLRFSLLRFTLLLFGLFWMLNTAQAAVWPIRAQWDSTTEQAYSSWVQKNFHSEFFFANTPYAEIETDCADAAYGMRMVFAFEHGLPFTIRDPRNARQLISEQTSRFDRYPEGLPRFLAFMDWIMSITSTATLVNDTYPIKIDREQIRPGIIYLTWHTHAMQVVRVRDTGVIRYLASTTPRANRPMRSTIGYPLYVPGDPKARRYGDGFRRFKQPADYGRPDDLLEGYSIEQFQQAEAMNRELLPYYEWVQQRLALVSEPTWINVRRAMISVCEMAWDRGNAVAEAQKLLIRNRQRGRACMSAAEYEEHSTPGRDRQLWRAFEHLEKISSAPRELNEGMLFRDYADHIFSRLAEVQARELDKGLLEWCDIGSVDGGPGRAMNITELYGQLKSGRLQADPHANPRQRWGLESFTPRCRAGR
jgi:hypothetical protein